MTSNLIQPSADAIRAITLHGDYSKISEDDRLHVVLSLCDSLGLNPSMNPFMWLKNEKTGAISLYAKKEASAQLASNRKLKVEVLGEGLALESVYTVKVRVTEGDRITEDVGAVPVTYFKKGENGQPGAWARVEGAGLADAIMKAHTKATRRTVLKHCGLGLDDRDEPLVVVDTPVTVQQEPPKPVEQPKELPAPKVSKDKWTGKIERVENLESNGKAVWALFGDDGSEFKTADPKVVEAGIERDVEYVVTFEVNAKGTKLARKLRAVDNG